MRIAANTIAYNDEGLIRGCIESVKPYVEEHVVVIGDKPYFGEPQPPDKTKEIAEDLGALVINGVFPMDHDQRNVGLNFLESQDYDWILGVDSDHWMTEKDMGILLNHLSETSADAILMPQVSYWHDTDHVLVGDEFLPVIAIRPHVRYAYIANVDHPCEILDTCVVHHLCWGWPKDIYKKVTCYPHAPEFDGKTWYKENYLTWKEGEPARLPTGDLQTKKQSLPEELQKYLPLKYAQASL